MAHPIVIEEVQERWPRLFAVVRWQGCLSSNEAADLLMAINKGRACYGEAVLHYGGAKKLIADAYRNWPNVNGWMREWGFIPGFGRGDG